MRTLQQAFCVAYRASQAASLNQYWVGVLGLPYSAQECVVQDVFRSPTRNVSVTFLRYLFIRLGIPAGRMRVSARSKLGTQLPVRPFPFLSSRPTPTHPHAQSLSRSLLLGMEHGSSRSQNGMYAHWNRNRSLSLSLSRSLSQSLHDAEFSVCQRIPVLLSPGVLTPTRTQGIKWLILAIHCIMADRYVRTK